MEKKKNEGRNTRMWDEAFPSSERMIYDSLVPFYVLCAFSIRVFYSKKKKKNEERGKKPKNILSVDCARVRGNQHLLDTHCFGYERTYAYTPWMELYIGIV